jgi:hypothetical protein
MIKIDGIAIRTIIKSLMAGGTPAKYAIPKKTVKIGR